MKNKGKGSFRARIIIYAIASMILSCLVVSGIGLVINATKKGTVKMEDAIQTAEEKADMNSIREEGEASKSTEEPDFSEESSEEMYDEAPMEGTQNFTLFAENREDKMMNNAEPFAPGEREWRGARFERKTPLIGIATLIQVTSIGILFVVFFIVLTRRYSAYLNEITSAISRMSEGDFDVKISRRNESELLTIADGLNQMSEDIKGMIEREHETERAKNELITSVAHDLRTPLTSIIGYLELIYKKKDIPVEKKLEYAGIAYDKSKRLEGLTEDLFSFTKVSIGEIKLHRTEIDMVKLLAQLEDEFYPQIQHAGLEAEYRTELQSLMMNVDGDLMARAVANLISNAIKYGKDGKKLFVELSANETQMKLSITNYGKMIPKEDLEHIFDRFYRVESSRSTDTGGSGLGLAITQNIINMHGGQIEVTSDRFGTVFTVILPLENADERENTDI